MLTDFHSRLMTVVEDVRNTSLAGIPTSVIEERIKDHPLAYDFRDGMVTVAARMVERFR
jgi:hypothetical protein